MPRACRKSLKKWFRSAAQNAKIAPSIMMKKAPWNLRSARDTSDDFFREGQRARGLPRVSGAGPEHRAAALHHGGGRRRRQGHAVGAAVARFKSGHRRSPRSVKEEP